MTIRELFEKACKEGVEDLRAKVQYRDGGGDYYGFDELGEEYFVVKDGVVFL